MSMNQVAPKTTVKTGAKTAMQVATLRMAQVLRAENQALSDGDLVAAGRLLPEKESAATALRAALPDAVPDPDMAALLRRLSVENGERLSLAIEVQGRILELVARAARMTAPAPGQYGRRGTMAPGIAAQALALRA